MDCALEIEKRVEFIRRLLADSGCSAIVFGNSGGKDCALVGILCKLACEDTLSVVMPCGSRQNFGSDLQHARTLCEKFGIESIQVDLSGVQQAELQALKAAGMDELNRAALTNIAPRLRMTTLYTVAAQRKALVAGTGNRSERYMGYFTKWGDGAFDFNPISDLTVGEVYQLLRQLGAPAEIIEKAPSAGLFEGQTDEKEMGVTYGAIDRYILTGEGAPEDIAIINRYHSISHHKRRLPAVFRENPEDKL